MHLRTRSSLHDMWSRGIERKPSRIKSPSSLRNRLQIVRSKQQQSPNAADSVQNAETTKAVAWAVFQHNGGGDGRANPGHLHGYHPMGVRRPTRFKIEAQMKQEITHRSAMQEVVAVRWEAGSTLFDLFELDSLLKTLDEATHPGDRKEAEAGAVVVYSPKQEISKASKFLHEDVVKPAFKSSKETSQSTLWKSFIHSLHLDVALFHGLRKLQSQVAPHDSKPSKVPRSPKLSPKSPKLSPKSPKLSPKSPKSPGTSPRPRHVSSSTPYIDVAQFDALFGGYEFPVSKDGRHFWKLSFKAPFTKDQAWAAAAFAAATTTTTTTTLRDETTPGVSHHHHHHHHHQHHQHHHDVGEDYELTVQAISRRVARASLDEKVRRVSMEFESGMEAPRNSLDIDCTERFTLFPKPRSVWDSY